MSKILAAEHVSHLTQPTLDASLRLADFYFGNVRRLVDLQVSAAKHLYVDTVENFKKLNEVRDTEDFGTLRGGYTEVATKRVAEFANGFQELLKEGRSEFVHLVDKGLAEYTRNIVGAVEKALDKVPSRAEGVISALKASVHAASASVDSVSKAVKNAGNYVDAGVEAAVGATTSAVAATKRK